MDKTPNAQGVSQRDSWQDACNDAYQRIARDSGKNDTQMAGYMGVNFYSLQQWLKGRRLWPINGAIALAAASDQEMIPMLNREVEK